MYQVPLHVVIQITTSTKSLVSGFSFPLSAETSNGFHNIPAWHNHGEWDDRFFPRENTWERTCVLRFPRNASITISKHFAYRDAAALLTGNSTGLLVPSLRRSQEFTLRKQTPTIEHQTLTAFNKAEVTWEHKQTLRVPFIDIVSFSASWKGPRQSGGHVGEINQCC